MRTSLLALLLVFCCSTPVAWARAEPISATGYDAAANPSVMLRNALADAQASGRKVLVIAGGDWCRWCMALEAFVARNADVKAALNKTFVPIEVYVGEKNANTEFLAALPKAKGYPHFWVLDSDGKLLQSVDTGPFENGAGGYDKARFLRFIGRWSQGAQGKQSR
jgi:thioredoxin-related protein